MKSGRGARRMAPLSEALLRRNEVLHPADRRIAVQGKRHVKVYNVSQSRPGHREPEAETDIPQDASVLCIHKVLSPGPPHVVEDGPSDADQPEDLQGREVSPLQREKDASVPGLIIARISAQPVFPTEHQLMVLVEVYPHVAG